MNSNNWHKGFDDPRALGAAEVAWLEQAVASFPYSAALHALYAKALKNENHYLAPQALRRAAVVSPNRRSLMAWMEGSEFFVVRGDGPDAGDQKGANSTLYPSNGAEDRSADEVLAREAREEVAPVAVLPEHARPTASEVPVSRPGSAPAADTDLSHLPEKVREAILRSRAISSRLHPQEGAASPAIPVQFAAPAVPPAEVGFAVPTAGTPEKAGTSPLVGHQKVVVSKEEVRNDPSFDEVQSIDRPPGEGPKESSVKAHSPFAQWLAQQTGDVRFTDVSGHWEMESAGGTGSASPVEKEQGTNGESSFRVDPQPVVPQPVANALIDKFLEREGPLRPAQSQRRSGDLPAPQVDLSASSLGGDPVFMTETLAQLYLQQGAFDKAVQAYEILRLKYPEKSAIFAAQILEIRLTQRNKKP
jgi:hypothetical protein